MHQPSVNRVSIAAAYAVTRPLIRRTPIIEVAGADFGLGAFRSFRKLELLTDAFAGARRIVIKEKRHTSGRATGLGHDAERIPQGELLCGGNTTAVDFGTGTSSE